MQDRTLNPQDSALKSCELRFQTAVQKLWKVRRPAVVLHLIFNRGMVGEGAEPANAP